MKRHKHHIYRAGLDISLLVCGPSVHRGAGEGDAEGSEAAGPCHRS